MRIFNNKFICPHCFEKSSLSEIIFRCENDGRCPPQPDLIYSRFINRNIQEAPPSILGQVISPNKKGWLGKINFFDHPKSARCPACKDISKKRICPKCHSELPFTVGGYKDLTLSIIGAKETGKSHYVAVLIDVIKDVVGEKFDVSLSALNDETIKRYNTAFYNPIFSDRSLLQATDSARADFDVRTPLIYSIKFQNKILWGMGPKKITDASTLVFFDTAGEDLKAEDVMRTENKYIYNSQGIILLIDPLQIESVRQKLQRVNPNVELPEKNTEAEEIITRTANLIKRAKGMRTTDLIETPIAIAFSKIDALKEVLSRNSAFHHEGNHDGYFNQNDFNAVNDEIQGLLEEWMNGNRIVRQVKDNFKFFGFFGLSSLGAPPVNGHISKLKPFRVEDPFLWLLHHHKLIKGKK